MFRANLNSLVYRPSNLLVKAAVKVHDSLPYSVKDLANRQAWKHREPRQCSPVSLLKNVFIGLNVTDQGYKYL